MVTTAEHREKLRQSVKHWWVLNKDTPFVKQRNAKISKLLTGNILVGATLRGIRTGPMLKCIQCGAQFQVQPSKKEQQFCSKDCFFGYLKGHGSKKRGRKTSANLDRSDLIKNIGHCEICGFTDKRILIKHHKDKNIKNNLRDNLLLLCPNCHTMVHLENSGKLKIKTLSNRDILAGREW